MLKKVKYLFVLFLLQLPYAVQALPNTSWELLYQPRQRIVKSVAVSHGLVFIGTGNGVFFSDNDGKTWKDFGSSDLQKDNNGNSLINWIFTDDENENIFIATSIGAYYSSIYEANWKQIFENTKTESNQINSITVHNNEAYISTSDGFWLCDLKADLCSRLNEGIAPDTLTGNHEVLFANKIDNDFYLSASNGFYIFNKEKNVWESRSNGLQMLPDGNVNARHFLKDTNGRLWLASGTGVYFSNDNALTWQKANYGIKQNIDGFSEVFLLSKNEEKLCVATASGVYCLNDNLKNIKWGDISTGLRTKEGNKNVYWLSIVNNRYFAATDEGLFVSNVHADSSDSTGTLLLKGKIETDFANLEELEPSVVEVQKQALKFASLPTDKDYKRYRLQTRVRNLIPRVAIDLNDTGTNTNYLELGKGINTDVSLNNQFDSDRTTRYQKDGKSFKQLSLLWNTNDFIYDNDIKEILSQARLTANIRENLLDDVTRIYFQRRKLQLESILLPPTDLKDKLGKNLTISELSGQLDSRTGGWFTQEIERRKRLYSNE